MRYNPYKILLWFLFIIVVLVNSIRLFIYGFVLSFIIVLFDRAFFGTRKRSDTQFLNLFFTLTCIFAFCYTFSPFFRKIEFEISHPKWQQYEIISIEKENTWLVHSTSDIIEKIYTPIRVNYRRNDGQISTYRSEVKHYAMLVPPPFQDKIGLEKELRFIHERSLNKLIDNRSIHIYQHPHKNKVKVFKGNDAFALRHSIGFHIGLIITYVLALVLTIKGLFSFRNWYRKFFSSQKKEKHTARIFFGILVFVYVLLFIIIVHCIRFVH